MKINLDTKLKADSKNGSTVRLGDVFEEALFKSTNVSNARELYDKVHGKKEAELKVNELSEIQKAIESRYIAGIKWQVSDIINKE